MPAWSLAAQQRLMAGPDAARNLAEQQRLAQLGESRLAAGDTDAAQQAFDEAAFMVHSPDVEMALVRTWLQAGDYRRALSFAAHAAGAHRNLPAGAALYAWLLQIGGQGVYAQRLLADALALAPDDVALRATQAELTSPWPRPGPELLQAPLRAAPYATGAEVPAAARQAGTAMLVADGSMALVPAASVQGALAAAGSAAQSSAPAAIWLRNGLGQTVAVSGMQPARDPRLLLLRLAQPLPMPPDLTKSARPPFAGSPGYMVEHGADASPQALWPLLRQGFFGRTVGVAGQRLLGLDVPPGPRGGPVFDALGDLAGVALATPGGPDQLVPADALSAELSLPQAKPAAPGQQRERAAVDAVYETALRLSLQVLVGH